MAQMRRPDVSSNATQKISIINPFLVRDIPACVSDYTLYLFGFSHKQQLFLMFWRLVSAVNSEPSSGHNKQRRYRNYKCLNSKFVVFVLTLLLRPDDGSLSGTVTSRQNIASSRCVWLKPNKFLPFFFFSGSLLGNIREHRGCAYQATVIKYTF
jgi:hypothetical protein